METANEHFKPRSIALRKAKLTTADAVSADGNYLEALLPPDKDTVCLLLAYLSDSEIVHRVVHSTFYHPWSVEEFVARLRGSQNDATTALVLAMITISVTLGSADPSSPGPEVQSLYKRMLPSWISACEKWLRLQNSKHRDLEYSQVSCLVYLARRMNGIRKKRFWNETGALVQGAVMDLMHLDPPSTDGPYRQEMKRRLWSTIRELDLQNSFDFGLPTILHSLESDVATPENDEDRRCGQDSASIRTETTPHYQYTRASYQNLAARSWRLRLDISRALCSSGGGKALSNEDVLRYTEELSQAIDALPTQTVKSEDGNAADRSSIGVSMLAKAHLICQLKDCVLALHRHRIQRGSASFSSLSESICYNLSKDILSINKGASEAGLRSLHLLREDILTASLTITRITLQQPPAQPFPSALLAGGGGAMTVDTSSSLALLEQCLPVIEELYLRCFNGEPWCPLTMIGAIMLLKIHAGTETRQTARAATAQRFLDVYYKHLLEHEMTFPSEGDLVTPSAGLVDLDSCNFDMDWNWFMGFEQGGAAFSGV